MCTLRAWKLRLIEHENYSGTGAVRELPKKKRTGGKKRKTEKRERKKEKKPTIFSQIGCSGVARDQTFVEPRSSCADNTARRIRAVRRQFRAIYKRGPITGTIVTVLLFSLLLQREALQLESMRAARKRRESYYHVECYCFYGRWAQYRDLMRPAKPRARQAGIISLGFSTVSRCLCGNHASRQVFPPSKIFFPTFAAVPLLEIYLRVR